MFAAKFNRTQILHRCNNAFIHSALKMVMRKEHFETVSAIEANVAQILRCCGKRVSEILREREKSIYFGGTRNKVTTLNERS